MTKEQIYDEQIFPLMGKIVEICQQHKIATVASFHIPNEEDPDLACTTILTTAEFDPPQRFKDATRILYQASAPVMHLTTVHADGSKTITAIV